MERKVVWNVSTETRTIEYLGETLESKWFINDVTQEEIQTVRENYYTFDEEKYLKQLNTVMKGGTEKGWVINHINSKHYDKIMGNVKLYHSKWTINEALQSDELLSYFIARTKSNPKIFTKDIVSNVKTVIRLGGKGVAAKPTNFPIKEGVKLLQKYTQHIPHQDNITYIDLTAGWGDRLLAAMKLGFNYYGIDLNKKVVDASTNLINDLKREELIPSDYLVKIVYGDATVTNNVCINNADIVLTSPPYFYLEVYEGEKQAQVTDSYEEWKENFVKPFMQNAFQYLKSDRYALINVTDYKEYTLVQDFQEMGVAAGFEFKGYDSLKNIKRTNSKGGFNNNKEDVLVFYKK